MHVIKLIDFGGTTSIFDERGSHIQEQHRKFAGNIAFASGYSLCGRATSKRDDLISLVYMLFYIHSGSLSFLKID